MSLDPADSWKVSESPTGNVFDIVAKRKGVAIHLDSSDRRQRVDSFGTLLLAIYRNLNKMFWSFLNSGQENGTKPIR
jgi:hypothetical protein